MIPSATIRACSVDQGRVLPLTVTQRVLHLIGACTGAAGLVLAIVSIRAAASSSLLEGTTLLVLLLTVSAMVCGRFPISMGVNKSFISLDSIPLVLAVLLLPTHLAVLMVLVTTNVAMWGQPRLPGLRGLFWRVESPLAVGLAVGAASWLAHTIVAGDMPGPVLLIPAFVVAFTLELLVDLSVLVDLEADRPGSWRMFADAWVSPMANIFLPTVAAAVLTPYVRDVSVFSVLLPILLVVMYGALWIANSQQLERRRGERLRDTFSRYVPDGVVDENLETMQQVELGGEQCDVTVLFCDIRGFTSWSEDKGATEVITELNVLLSELSASVMETGGTLDKFTGDGLMAFWGAP
ncbi:MAG: putative transrane sensor domain protein, partial [Thermoleophilia bacterium]|nr:putative transrane sensor domain protein [Thermoleophilia bacterium]